MECTNDQQFDNVNSLYMSLNEKTGADQGTATINTTYENAVLDSVECQRSTYTALDSNNMPYMSLNDATRADQDTAAINPTNDSAFDSC